MAKRNAAPAAAPAAPSAGIAASLAARTVADKALDLGGKEPGVIEWDPGNGVSAFQAGDLPPDVAQAEAEGKEAPETAVAPKDAPDDAQAQAKKTTDDANAATEGNQADGQNEPGTLSHPAGTPPAAKPKGAEARRATFDALAAEQRRVALETQARQNADRATAAEQELARIKSLPLKEQLKWLGADRESLSEAVLVGGDDVAELPEKPTAPKVDPVIEQLQAEVAALKAEKAQREQQTNLQIVTQAHGVVAEVLKDVTTVPLVKAVRDIVIDGQPVISGIDLTLRVANQAWLQAGKAGAPRDYIAGAAETVEQYLRDKRPDLAAVFVPAAGGTPAPKGDANQENQQRAANGQFAGGGPSIGKRTGARPDAQPKELPMDKYQRDQAIKREMGW